MILYLKDPKISTKKRLQIINTFDKVAGYKIIIQKSVTFLYINNEQAKKKIRETISFAIVSKTVKNSKKYLRINLTKEIKDLLMKTINTKEKNQRRHQKIESSPMLVDW
jgi:hypothetical protein